jgi:hypothetical protein
MSSRPCSGVNRFGKPCGSRAVGKDGLCNIHRLTPEQRKAMSARGGRNKGRHRDELPVSFDLVRWIVDLVVSVTSGTRSVSEAESYLAPSLTTSEYERIELRRSLEPLERPEEDEPLSQLEVAKQRLLALYAEGRIFEEELPPGVLH